MKKTTLLISLLLIAFTGSALAQQFQIPITVTDGNTSSTLSFGVDPTGTDGLDNGLDLPAPPSPPSGAFDARFRMGSEDFLKDIRENSFDQKTYALRYAAETGQGPIIVSWDPQDLAGLGTFVIVDDINQLLYGPIDMTTTSSIDVSTSAFITSSLRILVTPSVPNAPPTAVDDTATTDEDVAVDISPLANDSDPEGDAFSLTGVGSASNGIAEDNGDGTITYTPDTDFHGEDTFTYTIEDSEGGTDQGTVTVTVDPINDDPVGADDTGTTNEDTEVDIDVLPNDTDVDTAVDGDVLFVSAVDQPTNGTTSINPDGTIKYTPNQDHNGSDTFTYTVSDGNGGTDTATVTVTINPINDDPVAVDDTPTTDEDTAITFDPRTNDTDVDGDALTLTAVGAATNGGAVDNGDGTITYTPNANYHGTDTFTYDISDGNGGTDQGSITVTVTSVNDYPVGGADAVTIDEDTPVDINVLANDTDVDTAVDGDILSVSAVDQPTNGTTSINPDGTIKYTPNQDHNGSDTFTYTVSDGNGGTDTATVTVTINPINDDPVANTDNGSTTQGVAVTIDVLVNDTDPENDTLTITAVSTPSSGAAVDNGDGTITYTPGASFNGTDTFTYDIADGNGGTDQGTVNISINGFPVAVDDDASTDEDTAVTISPLDNDTDPENDQISLTGVGEPTNGEAVDNGDGTITYTPDLNWHGTDTFTYDIEDSEGGTDQGTVTVEVAPVNDAPVAGDDTATTDEDTPVDIDVLANDTDVDTDVDGDILSVSAVNQPTYGATSINPDGTIRYEPDANYFGPDSFTYEVSDGNGGTDEGEVTLTVTEVNDTPDAVDDDITTSINRTITFNPLDNDTDADGDPLTITALGAAAHGTVTNNGDGTVDYAPDTDYLGLDTFTYTIEDGRGGTDTATVNMTVIDNAIPVLGDDTGSTDEDTPVTFSDLLDNDTDPDNDPFSITAAGPGVNGTAVVNADGTVTYTPATDFNGTDTFPYTVTDDRGGSAIGTVTVTVAPINDAPVGVDDAATTDEDTAVDIDVLANDTDVEGDDVSVSARTNGAKGTTSVNGDGTIKYRPNQDQNGTDTFTYTVSDGNGGTEQGTVTVTITPVNDAPAAVDDSPSTNEDTAITFDPRTNDTDVDGDVLSVTVVGAPSNGRAVNNGDGTITYIPNANFNGTDAFTYDISDGNGGTDQGSVTVTVDPVNDAPVAVDDEADTTVEKPYLVRVLENDTDIDGDVLSIATVGTPTNGTAAEVTPGTITYTPNAGFTGTDSFTYTISDGNGETDGATATIVVTELPVDDDGVDEVVEDAAPNDGDGDGDGVQDSEQANVASLPNTENGDFITIVSDPTTLLVAVDTEAPPEPAPAEAEFPIGFLSYGVEGLEAGAATTITIHLENATTANSYWKYGPTPDDPTDHWYNFAYDGSTGAVIDGATIVLHFIDGQRGDDDLTVNGYVDDPGAPAFIVNRVPVGNDDSSVGNEDEAQLIAVLANDTDDDGDTLMPVEITVLPSSGACVINADGTITYTPMENYNGTDSFSYSVGDGNGGVSEATVDIAVIAVNDNPTALDDAYALNEDQTIEITPLENDTDIDGDALSIVSVFATNNGAVSLYENEIIRYVPMANYFGTDSFKYRISDGAGGEAEGTVTVTVGSVNDLPLVVDDRATTDMNTAVNLDVMANDSDVDGDTLSVQSVGEPSNGTSEVLADGTVRYTPDTDYFGTDEFTYTVSDGNGGTATASVLITIVDTTEPNRAPVAADDEASTDEDSDVLIDVLQNDVDLDGDILSVSIETAPVHGTATVTIDSNILYVPTEDFFGPDSLIYTVSDPAGLSGSATVTFTVAPVNDAPTFGTTEVLIRPTDGDEVWIGAKENETPIEVVAVQIEFVGASDVDGDALNYTWEMSADASFQTVIWTRAPEQLMFEISADDIVGTLNQLGLMPFDQVTLYHRVSASDPDGASVVSPVSSVVFGRGLITGTESEGEVPDHFELYNNYPNPFNPTTVIRFDVPRASHVRVELYDVLGRRIKVLLDTDKAPGRYEILFDAETLLSGVYLYSLRAEGYSTTRMMIVSK